MSMAESTEHGASAPGVSGVASTPAAMVEIAACAWDIVHAAELPDGLGCPGVGLARALPDGGWCGHGWRESEMPRLRFGSASPGCGAALPAPRRPDQPRQWLCTDHVSGWHVAVGVAVMAIWRLPNGGDQS